MSGQTPRPRRILASYKVNYFSSKVIYLNPITLPIAEIGQKHFLQINTNLFSGYNLIVYETWNCLVLEALGCQQHAGPTKCKVDFGSSTNPLENNIGKDDIFKEAN